MSTKMSKEDALAFIQQLAAQEKVANKEVLAAVSELTAPLHKSKLVPTGTEACLNAFISTSPEIEELKRRVRILAPLADPVMILGETGTGKELIARALHGERKGRFVAFNCTALPSELLESELFGHEKGAFTHAEKARDGLFRAARDGTLFLDEIGDMPLDMQAKLLRVLQTGLVRPVGKDTEIEVNCRIVCATHRQPKDVLRLDLFYRLSYVVLSIPPLRARPREDIVRLIKRNDEDCVLDDSDIEVLTNRMLSCPLDGNVRQLQAMVRQYILFEKKQ